VPLRYLLASAVAFILAAAGAAWLAPELAGHYYHPRVVALTHTVTLGWMTLAIMGASYQIIPIVLERPVWSERLARWQFWILLLAVSGLVAHFWLGHGIGQVAAAAALAIGVGLHLYNVLRSLRGFDRWTFTARLVLLAYAGLALTLVFGLLLAVDRARAFLPGAFFSTLHAHVHLALLGWVAPMVIGVAARVYPMFLLASEPGGWPARAQLWGVGLGVPAVTMGLLFSAPALLEAGAMAVAAAAAGHLAWVAAMVRGRRRPRLDWGLRMALTGAAYLVPGAVIGLGLAADAVSGPRFAVAYAVLLFGGWISLTIAGMMLKIVPFLVWYRRYAPRAGTERVPSLADLSSPRAEAAAWVLLTAGVAALAGSVAIGDVLAIRIAAGVLSLGALAFGAALARVLWHLVSAPAAAPMPEGPPASGRAGAPAASAPVGSRPIQTPPGHGSRAVARAAPVPARSRSIDGRHADSARPVAPAGSRSSS
jgi:hypothetical protein